MARVFYFDCGTCGDGQDVKSGGEYFESVRTLGPRKGETYQAHRYFHRCGGCGTEIVISKGYAHTGLPMAREVNHTTHRNGRQTECSAACLNGKLVCDCQCKGRCHGAGTCSCTKRGMAPWAGKGA